MHAGINFFSMLGDPTLLLSGVDALNAALASELSQPRFRAALQGGFAALALLLSLVGLDPMRALRDE